MTPIGKILDRVPVSVLERLQKTRGLHLVTSKKRRCHQLALSFKGNYGALLTLLTKPEILRGFSELAVQLAPPLGEVTLAVARERAPYLLSRHPVLRASAELLRSLRGLVPHESGRRDLIGREWSQPDATKPAASPRGSSETALRHAIVVRELKQVQGSPSQPFLRSAPESEADRFGCRDRKWPSDFRCSGRWTVGATHLRRLGRVQHSAHYAQEQRLETGSEEGVAFRLSDARTPHRS